MKYSFLSLALVTTLALFAQNVCAATAPDTAFNTNIGEKISNGAVYFVEVQDDGKVLIGGTFLTYDGVSVGRMIRLNADGTPDTAFNTALGSGFGNNIQWIEQLSDGRIAVGGNFSTFNGASRGRLVVLNDDGTEDATFLTHSGAGVAGSFVGAIEELPDGDILVAGAITSYDGVSRTNLIRLNSDGTEDTVFAANLPSINSFVRGIEVQDDGKIVISGAFTSFGSNASNRIARLNTDGTEDAAFGLATGTGFDNFVFRSDQDADGNLYFAGNFTSFNSTPVGYVAKVSEDGVIDSTFSTNIGTGSNDDLLSVRYASSSDTIYLAGNSSMATFNGFTAARIARLNLDGSFDEDFGDDMGTGFNGQMQYVFPYGNHVYAAGSFTSFNSATSTRLMRFIDTPPDTTEPTMTITSAAPSNVTEAFTVTFTADEDIVEFDSSDVSVSNGVLSDFQSTVASTTWTALITPTAAGVVTVTVAAGSFEDLVGNEVVAQAQLTRTYVVEEVEEEDEEDRSSRSPSGRRSRAQGSAGDTRNEVDVTNSDNEYELQACKPYLQSYIRPGSQNNADDVRKLEQFLNEFAGEKLEVDGVYEQEDIDAVKRYQTSRSSVLSFWNITEPTGNVYVSTLKAINKEYCQETLGVTCPYFTGYYTSGDVAPEISRIKQFLTVVEGEVLDSTNVFDQKLGDAIVRFQNSHAKEILAPWGLERATGNWYQSTKKFADDVLGCYAPVRLDNGTIIE